MNTAGAALGCFLTDFVLVPFAGLRGAQVAAVLLNVVAGMGGLFLAMKVRVKPDTTGTQKKVRLKPDQPSVSAIGRQLATSHGPVPLTALALALSGFAAMGLEILWFRHVSILLGGFRAVFSLLLTVILIGIGAGSLASGFLLRRMARPAQWLMFVQALFVVSTLLGLAISDARDIERIVIADRAFQAAAGRTVEAALGAESGWARAFTELWFNARPILLEVAIPALLMGFTFPLANAIIQRASVPSVAARAFSIFPTRPALCSASGRRVPASSNARDPGQRHRVDDGGRARRGAAVFRRARHPNLYTGGSGRLRAATGTLAGSRRNGLAVVAAAVGLCDRAGRCAPRHERLVALSEGVNEVIAVTDGRTRDARCSPTAIRCRRPGVFAALHAGARRYPAALYRRPETFWSSASASAIRRTRRRFIRRSAASRSPIFHEVSSPTRAISATPTAMCCAILAWWCSSTTDGTTCRCSLPAPTT